MLHTSVDEFENEIVKECEKYCAKVVVIDKVGGKENEREKKLENKREE